MPYRPLFVEKESVVIKYTLNEEELEEAVIEYVRKRVTEFANSADDPEVWVERKDSNNIWQYSVLSKIRITLVEDTGT